MHTAHSETASMTDDIDYENQNMFYAIEYERETISTETMCKCAMHGTTQIKNDQNTRNSEFNTKFFCISIPEKWLYLYRENTMNVA